MIRPSRSRLLASVGIVAAAVAVPLVFAALARAGPSHQNRWGILAQCESGGNRSTNIGNGYYGGLQFHPGTWQSYGGEAYADTANRATRRQLTIAERVLNAQGWKASLVSSVWDKLTDLARAGHHSGAIATLRFVLVRHQPPARGVGA